MADYLSEFLENRIKPYREVVELLQLEKRYRVRGNIEMILDLNFGYAIDGKPATNPIINISDSSLNLLYEETARLAHEFGKLIAERSIFDLRIGEDYAEVYSEIMGLFGEDKRQIKDNIHKALEDKIETDMALRISGVKPHHIQAILAKYN